MIWGKQQKIIRALLVILACASTDSPLLAQTSSGPKDFFENNFAAGTSENNAPEMARGRVRSRETKAGTSRADPFLATPNEILSGGSQGDAAEDGEVLTSGKKVNFIHAFINGEDEQHFDEKFKELLTMAENKPVPIGIVYSVGAYPKFIFNLAKDIPQDLIRLAQQRGLFRVVKKMPEAYPAKLSPAWVVDTDEGQILLEATGPLTNHFNKKGEFLDPRNSTATELSEIEKIELEEIKPLDASEKLPYDQAKRNASQS